MTPGNPLSEAHPVPGLCRVETSEDDIVIKVLYSAPFPVRLKGQPLLNIEQDIVEAYLEKHLTRLPNGDEPGTLCVVYRDGVADMLIFS